LNGGNPALKKIQQEIDEMKEDFKRNNEKWYKNRENRAYYSYW
jgi:hypothetical protein